MNLRVSGFGAIERPRIAKLPQRSGSAAPSGHREVYFERTFRNTPVYQRDGLAPGVTIAGPAIIEEFGSTTVVFPGQQLAVDDYGIMIVRPGKTAQGGRA